MRVVGQEFGRLVVHAARQHGRGIVESRDDVTLLVVVVVAQVEQQIGQVEVLLDEASLVEGTLGLGEFSRLLFALVHVQLANASYHA